MFSTYLGGSGRDWGKGIALDAAGNPVVVGWTESSDFPMKSPLQATLSGPGAPPINGFITRVSSSGDRVLNSTYFGGGSRSGGNSVALDDSGAIYILGTVRSDGFPVKNAIQATFGGGPSDLLLAKVTPSTDSVVYSTYLGGNDLDIFGGLAVDQRQHLYHGYNLLARLSYKELYSAFRRIDS